MKQIKLLYIEDNKFDQITFRKSMEGLSYIDTVIASSIEEAKDLIISKPLDVIVSDYSLGDGTALDILNLNTNIPLIVTTGTGNEEIAVNMMKAGARDYLIKDTEGNYLKVLPTVIDKSIKNMEAEEAQAKLLAIVEHSGDAIIGETLDGKVVSWNHGAERLYGYSAEEMMGESVFKLVPEGKVEELEKIFQRLSEGDFFEHFETSRIKKDGSVVNVLLSLSPIKDSKGNITGVAVVGRDITEWKKNEAALIRSEVELARSIEQQNKKDEFIGVASHELKTPLTSIKAYLQLAERELHHEGHVDLNSLRTIVEKTNKYTERLNGLISELLDVSRTQAGKMEYHLEQIDFDEWIQNIINGLQILSDHHKITLTGIAGLKIKLDRNRMEQVVTNFITNAIKYSPGKDKILVNVNCENGNVIVSVTDYGVGIAKENFEKIFDRFFRVEDKNFRFTGLGIGLFISKEIISRHGGKTWVESEEGKGATFYFSIPIEPNTA